MNLKGWYKNPIVIGLILASAGWFSWVTKTAIIVPSKADESSIRVTENKLDNLCSSLNKLEGSINERNNKQDLSVAAIIASLRSHEAQQTQQIEKIYSLLIQMSRENKAAIKENRENRK